MRRKIIIFLESAELVDICLQILNKTKIKKIIQINDKLDPFYVIIITTVSKKQLLNILNKHIKYQFELR